MKRGLKECCMLKKGTRTGLSCLDEKRIERIIPGSSVPNWISRLDEKRIERI
jgi:hypothetical protein